MSCCLALSRTDDTIQKYYFNITNHFSWSPVEVTLGLYTSLCQYFSEQERRWKTEGIVPLEETRPDQAVCLTQHLTAFGASLFVPPNSVQFIFPVSRTKQRLCDVVTSEQPVVTWRSWAPAGVHVRAGWWLADQHPYPRTFGSRRQAQRGCVPWARVLAADAKSRRLQMALFPSLNTSQCAHLFHEMPNAPPSCQSIVLSQRACTCQLLPGSREQLGLLPAPSLCRRWEQRALRSCCCLLCRGCERVSPEHGVSRDRSLVARGVVSDACSQQGGSTAPREQRGPPEERECLSTWLFFSRLQALASTTSFC